MAARIGTAPLAGARALTASNVVHRINCTHFASRCTLLRWRCSPAPPVQLPPAPARRSACTLCRAFEGDAGKALKEAAALDELIDLLMEAKSQQEVRQR
jgi:hypothetical protein